MKWYRTNSPLGILISLRLQTNSINLITFLFKVSDRYKKRNSSKDYQWIIFTHWFIPFISRFSFRPPFSNFFFFLFFNYPSINRAEIFFSIEEGDAAGLYLAIGIPSTHKNFVKFHDIPVPRRLLKVPPCFAFK